jgi:4-nitrophenyl phosphatase
MPALKNDRENMTMTGSHQQPSLRNLRGIVMDMDGVLYRGDEATPGLVEFFRFLDEHGLRYLLLTNNSTTLPSGYVKKMAKLGVTVPEEAILTSGIVLKNYLREHYPAGTQMYGVCMPALRELVLDGTGYVWDEETPQVVISSADWEVTYAKLRTACLGIRRGADWIATNTDKTLPTEAGLVPGSGALVAALETATDQHPLALGKPELPMMEQALARIGLTAAETAMLGDRLDTDILGGINARMLTIMVETGVSTAEEATQGPIKPDYLLAGLPALVERFRQELAPSIA